MVKSAWRNLYEAFWDDYKQKNYTKIIDDIPKLLKFKYRSENVSRYREMCTFLLIVMKTNKTINDSLLKQIFEKFEHLITTAKDPFAAMQSFICLEYACELSNFSQAVDGHLINKIANKVLYKIKTAKDVWNVTNRTTLNRFIVVAVKLESFYNDGKLTFAPAKGAIEFFSSIMTDDMKSAYPEYLCSTLQTLILYRDDNADGINELLRKVRYLVKSTSKIAKDIAIMMSQIIRASTFLISKGSLQFKNQIFVILNDLYDLVRSKSLPAGEYLIHKTYNAVCCDRLNTHIGLQILETARIIFVEAMNSSTFNEIIVSVVSSFATVEIEIIAQLDCKHRELLKNNLWQTLRAVTENIGKIVTTCGLERAKRTLQKFLATKSLQPSEYYFIIKALLDICKDADNKTEQIDWSAMEILYSSNEQSRIYYMHAIHKIQNQLNDPEKIQTISSIVKRLPLNKKYPNFSDVQLQLLQITVEINHPTFSPLCLQKLVDGMREMDFYKSDPSCYANLCKSGVCYLVFLTLRKLYKSNVKYEKHFQPLNEKFVSLKTEIEEIKTLQEALDYLAKFLLDKDVWMAKEDRTVYIPLVERLFLDIGETLIGRHYKDLSVTAFDLLYKFAKLVDNPHNQMIAAGYLIENMHLTSTISEQEIVTELQSFIMQKLKDVNTMKSDELGRYLFSFLQLTMYTMRYQLNIEHAKKYMQAINKLLNKYDSNKEKYSAARIKYAEVMFELIVNDPDTTITPVTFIEDIFYRFKNIRYVSQWDHLTVPGIVLDLLITLYAFTQPRYELRYTSSLCWTIRLAAIRNGYVSLFAKVTVLSSTEMILTNRIYLEDHMKQLDVVFACQRQSVQTESEVEAKTTWNKDITSLIHSHDCKCFQCTNKFLHSLSMEVAAMKASAIYFNKDYQKSLESYQQIYRHWNASNTTSYSDMLMHYSNCLISNSREDRSERILNEALDSCNDSAQAQDISVRLLVNAMKDELQIDQQVPSYAAEVRAKAVRAKAVRSKKKANCKSILSGTDPKERDTYPKRLYLRN